MPFQEGEPSGWWLATVTKTKGEVRNVIWERNEGEGEVGEEERVWVLVSVGGRDSVSIGRQTFY